MFLSAFHRDHLFLTRLVLLAGLHLASRLFLRQESHRSPKLDSHKAMDVHVLGALSDNYMYVLVDKATREAAVVDPVEPKKVLDLVKSLGLRLTTVLTTHHHYDHAGGNKELLEAMPTLRILGGEERVEAVSQIVATGDKVQLGNGNIEVQCFHTPCHTKGHICYKASAGEETCLFTGDTMFIAGAGKFFEGTAEQMLNNMVNIIGGMADETKIYCGHEYTLSNLKYAKHVEPKNEHIDRMIEFAEKCKLEKVPTVPSTVAKEKQINPFMRVNQPSVQEHVKHLGDPTKTMAALRNEKNNFRA